MGWIWDLLYIMVAAGAWYHYARVLARANARASYVDQWPTFCLIAGAIILSIFWPVTLALVLTYRLYLYVVRDIT